MIFLNLFSSIGVTVVFQNRVENHNVFLNYTKLKSRRNKQNIWCRVESFLEDSLLSNKNVNGLVRSSNLHWVLITVITRYFDVQNKPSTLIRIRRYADYLKLNRATFLIQPKNVYIINTSIIIMYVGTTLCESNNIFNI